MKEISAQEFESAPSVIQYIVVCSIYGIPVGLELYKNAKAEYPEYFKQ